jgi:hypothetical protein
MGGGEEEREERMGWKRGEMRGDVE